MAVTDLWYSKGDPAKPTKRCGRGLRYRVTVPGHPAKSFRLKRAAETHEAQLLTQGPPKPQATTTVAELIDAWQAGKQHLSPKGREAVSLAARAVRPVWGDMLASGVTREAVQAWISAEPGSASRKHKLAQCLAGALGIAVARGIIDANPATGLALPSQVRREPVYLTAVQVGRIADHADGWGMGRTPDSVRPGWYGPMVWFMATNAARIGEVCALNVGDVVRRRVDGEWRWRARVGRAKGNRGRDLPVPERVVAMLDLDRPGDDPLFVTVLGSRVLKDNWRARVWQRAVLAAKLPRVTPHDMRHTAISWAIADGADVKAVQRMAGHRSATVTLDVYGHLWDRGLDDVAARMDARVGR